MTHDNSNKYSKDGPDYLLENLRIRGGEMDHFSYKENYLNTKRKVCLRETMEEKK